MRTSAQQAWYKKNRAHILRWCQKYYLQNREHIKTRSAAYRERVRLEVLRHYGKGTIACACCGETQPKFLTLDHAKGNGNAHRRKIGKGRKAFSGYAFYLWLRKRKLPALPLQVLCFNCNCGRWRNGGECPHVAENKGII